MRVVKAETRGALMDVLRLVMVLAAVAFQWFTGHPVSLLRAVVTKLVTRQGVPIYPIRWFR